MALVQNRQHRLVVAKQISTFLQLQRKVWRTAPLAQQAVSRGLLLEQAGRFTATANSQPQRQ
jgi:hypothetical protein